MIRTAIALSRAKASRGCGPQKLHAMNASTAIPTTMGTNQAAMRSASRWMGARVRCASDTMRAICASSVSLPTRSAFMIKLPVVLTVPPVSFAAGSFSAGIGSPVTIDSSTALRPSTTDPSTGIFSPGRIRM